MSKLLEDSNGNLSSKRVAGYICGGIGLAGLVAVGVVSIFRTIEDPGTALESFKTVLIVGGSLLGIGVAEFFGQKA